MLNGFQASAGWIRRAGTHLWTRRFRVLLWTLSAALLAALKLALPSASHRDLLWMLGPTAALVELLTGLPFRFHEELGFYSVQAGVVINSGCAGVNFFITAALLSVSTMLPAYRRGGGPDGYRRRCVLLLILLFGLSYTAAVVINSLRIAAAWQVLSVIRTLPVPIAPDKAHFYTGILTFSCFLILYFIILQRVRERRRSWER